MLPILVFFIVRLFKRYLNGRHHARPVVVIAEHASRCSSLKFLVIFLLAIAPEVTAQPVQSPEAEASTMYLKKSKQQKVAAVLLAGGGSILAFSGMMAGLNEVFSPGYDSKDASLAAVLFYGGSIMALSSIPLFISSARNKKRAMQLNAAIKMEPVYLPTTSGISRSAYPALTLRFSLK